MGSAGQAEQVAFDADGWQKAGGDVKNYRLLLVTILDQLD
jgi:hypothetical protein